jgi:tRNA ligase
LKRPETQLYVKWVKREIGTNPGAFSEYNKGKGIIRTRERFLAWMNCGAKEDMKEPAVRNEKKEETADRCVFGKTIIVPVAIPGCGTLS